MIRLLIAATCALASCAAPPAYPPRVDAELRALAAAVQTLQLRLAAGGRVLPDVPRPVTEPAGESAKARSDPRRRPAAPKIAPGTPPRDAKSGPPPRQELRDPVAALARAVAARRAVLRSKNRPAKRSAKSPAKSSVKRRETPAERGRFQIAGVGLTAWQTVLDTHTGVIYNYRRVGGRNDWVAITTPVPDAPPPR